MGITYKEARIISNDRVIDNIFKMTCEDSNSVIPGQFYMLKAKGETFLARPISVYEKSPNSVTFLYAVVGKGTAEFSALKVGDTINLTGPVGNGFDVKSLCGKIALVAGGIGIAPFLEVAKALHQHDLVTTLDLYAGFRDTPYLISDFKPYVSAVHLASETGKEGYKGFVTDILNPADYDCILCCGPTIMMQKVVALCLEKQVKVFVSMEKKMACGVGACLGCTCRTQDGIKRTCVDGPVFDGTLIQF